MSCNVKVSLKNGTILQLTRVWVPEGTFQSNPLTRQFGKAPADANFNGVVLFAKTGVPEILRTAVQKTQVVGTRDGREPADASPAGEVSGEKLNPLVGYTLKPDVMYPVDLLDRREVGEHGADPRHRARRQRLAHRALRHE